MFKVNPKYKKYLRPFAGLIFLAGGSIFMLIPFIPLGYIMIFGGLFLLASRLPFLRKWVKKLKNKDKKGRVEKLEKNIEVTENNMIKDKKNEKFTPIPKKYSDPDLDTHDSPDKQL